MTALIETEATTLVRPATPADLPIIYRLLEAVGSYTSSLTFTGSTYWIARHSGRPVGVIGLEHGDGASLLRSAAVLPEARGRGVGRALTQSALTLATLRGDREVYLLSSDAGRYWQRHGFREVPIMQLAQTLPNAPQVVSGREKGWIARETAWCKRLEVPA